MSFITVCCLHVQFSRVHQSLSTHALLSLKHVTERPLTVSTDHVNENTLKTHDQTQLSLCEMKETHVGDWTLTWVWVRVVRCWSDARRRVPAPARNCSASLNTSDDTLWNPTAERDNPPTPTLNSEQDCWSHSRSGREGRSSTAPEREHESGETHWAIDLMFKHTWTAHMSPALLQIKLLESVFTPMPYNK